MATKILFMGPPASPHAADWIKDLEARGHDVHVATIHAIPEWTADRATALRGAGDVTRPGAMGDLLQAVPRLRRVLREVRPDVTIAYYLTSYGLLAALTGAPRIVGAAAGGDVLVHPFYSRSRQIRQRFLLSLTLKRLSKVFAWAPHVADRLHALGVPQAKIVTQPRGIDLDRFVPRRSPSPDETPVILSTRWFKKLYDLPTLVRALERLAADGHRFDARLVGEGPEEGALRHQVRAAGLEDRVSFVGKIGHEAMVDALDAADIYVSTSSTDGASASLFEAMAMGLFPVVSDIPANRPWITHGDNGELFPVGDDERLAAALAAALTDGERRRRAGRTNRDIVETKLNFKTNMRRLESELLSTLTT